MKKQRVFIKNRHYYVQIKEQPKQPINVSNDLMWISIYRGGEENMWYINDHVFQKWYSTDQLIIGELIPTQEELLELARKTKELIYIPRNPNDIQVTIYFHNDPSVGMQSVYYTIQIPDFRRDWTETDELLKTYIEEKRKQIQDLYEEFNGDGNCKITFSFEEPNYEQI